MVDFPSTTAPTTASNESFDADGALRHIQAQARYFFEPAEFAALTGRTSESAGLKKALVRLSSQGRIVLATKRPTGWLIIPPEQQHYGAPPVDWWLDDCLKRVEPNYYVALLSAARHWGSAHYALQNTQVMLGHPRLALKAGRLRVDFYAKQRLEATPTVVARGNVAPWRVSTREATLLDLIRHQADVGGIEAVARVAKDFAPSINGDALTLAINALDQVAAAQRLGFLLDRLGMQKHSRRVARWLEGKRVTQQPLVPQIVVEAKDEQSNRTWGIRYSPGQLAMLESMK